MKNLNLENHQNVLSIRALLAASHALQLNHSSCESLTFCLDNHSATLIRLVPRHLLPPAGEGQKHRAKHVEEPNSLLLMLGEGSGMRVDSTIADFCVREREIDLVGFHGI
jgi:hypothetical protein